MDFISNKTVNIIGVMEIAIINNSTSNSVLSIKLFISIYISKTNLDSPKYQTSEDRSINHVGFLLNPSIMKVDLSVSLVLIEL